MKKFILITLMISLILIAGCRPDKNGVAPQINNTVTPQTNNTIKPETSEFSFVIGDKHILLDDKEADAISFAGKPLSEIEEVLGPDADTYAGSFIKTLKYEGFEVSLFAGKDEKKYWIQNMKITRPNFTTKRGIKVGDNVEQLKNKYPDLEIKTDECTDINNCAYIYGNPYEEGYFIEFEIGNGVIKYIYMEHILF